MTQKCESNFMPGVRGTEKEKSYPSDLLQDLHQDLLLFWMAVLRDGLPILLPHGQSPLGREEQENGLSYSLNPLPKALP